MRQRSIKFSRLALLIALTITLQMAGLPQPAIGPLVNMMLIITTLVINPLGGLALGVVTPLVAVLGGQLPPLLIPMAPFIMIGNALFVILFAAIGGMKSALTEKEPLYSVWAWIGLVVAAAAKTAWLYLIVRMLLPHLIGKPVPAPLLALMSLPQFVTAGIGGSFAFLFFNILKRRFHLN